MTSEQRIEYIRAAKAAVIAAGLDVAAIEPENDYIETVCPKCHEIGIFKRSDLEYVRCRVCYKKKRQTYFESRGKELIEVAGFEAGYISYEEDYYEARCPECAEATGFKFEDLWNIYCKPCAMKLAAENNGFKLYREFDAYDTPWAERVHLWEEERSDEPAVLICENCGDVYIVNANAKDALEQIRKLRCICSATPKGFRRKYIGTPEPSINENKASYGTAYKKEEWPHNFLFDIVNASEYWMEPFDELPDDFENSLEYVLNSLPDQRGSTMLRMRYKEKLTLIEIGRYFGLTSERVRQIIRDQMQEIRNPFWLRYLRYGINDLVNQGDSGRTKNPIYKKGHFESEQKQLIHKCAIKWLNQVLTNTVADPNSRKKAGEIYYDELNESGIFIDGDAPLAAELEKLFSDTSEWHNVVKFARVINTVNDYKLLAYILLYKMRVYDSDIFTPRHREFFVVGFERLIGLTE